jgi:predicted enzyme related to lactoylglutathione lyase
MAVGALGQVHISVTDVDASVEFYRDVLGMTHLFTVPGQPMAFLQSGDVRLYLGVPTGEEYRSRCVLYFNVGDLDAEVARLRQEGVAMTEPHVVHRDAAGELWMSGLTDPDGHHLMLMQTKTVPE